MKIEFQMDFVEDYTIIYILYIYNIYIINFILSIFGQIKNCYLLSVMLSCPKSYRDVHKVDYCNIGGRQ